MYTTKKWSSKRKQVKVCAEIETIETSWGAMYSLYKEYGGSRYFADVSEGFGDVEQINATNDSEAVKIFRNWMEELEKEISGSN